MAKIAEANHFTCLLDNGLKCPRNFFNQPMCDGCSHMNKCENCGKKNTSFCLHCDIERGKVNESESETT